LEESDAAARDVEDAFMLGPDLLVAPVLEQGTTQRIVDLPMHPGGWYDWHDGSHFEGGRAVTVDAPLGRLPLFARAGAVIPVVEGTATTVIVFGASADSGFGRFYVDDGETAHWRRDGYSMEFRLRREGAGFVLERELSASAPASIPTIGVRAVDLPGPSAGVVRTDSIELIAEL
jgi:alpha-glucosidase